MKFTEEELVKLPILNSADSFAVAESLVLCINLPWADDKNRHLRHALKRNVHTYCTKKYIQIN